MSPLEPLSRHSDDRGHLVAVTGGIEVPFAIRRVFWIYGTSPDADRAGHASTVTTELLICLAGSCHAVTEGSEGREHVVLDRPDVALLVPPSTWLDLTDFTHDCVLLVLTDTEYHPEAMIDSLAVLRSRWRR